MPRLLCAVLTLVGVVLMPAASPAQGRRLFWDRLDVVAHLDAAGALAVTEVHAINFTGDWNGGERMFDLRGRQTLEFLGMWRLDGATRRAMTEDVSLADVDDYAWQNRNHLRWRSRRPSDPPFNRTVRRYEIQYVLTGVLRQSGDVYQINHDFAFPDRSESVEAFTLRLTLDPVWQAPADFPTEFASGPIGPGRGLVVNVPLRFTGAAPPVIAPAEPAVVRGIWVLFGLTAAFIGWFFLREQSRGRFAPVPVPAGEAWLREHVLAYRPEVVGAAWDGKVGQHEVVATLARLEHEGKIRSEAGPDGLILRVTVDREAFTSYERTLIDGLFFDGRTETTPDAVRARYKDTGFDPANGLRLPLMEEVGRIMPAGTPPRAQIRFVTPALVILGVLSLIMVGSDPGLSPGAVVLLVSLVLFFFAGVVTAARAANSLHWGRGAVLLCLLPAVAIVVLAAAAMWFLPDLGDMGEPRLGALGVVGVVALALAFVRGIIGVARTRLPAEVVAFRKVLAGARRYFESELRRPRPALRDEWGPWLLAFGLGPQMDAWSARRAGTASDDDQDDARDTSSSWTSTSPGGTPSWSGFSGGRSGGAGASAGWATAAAFAAPVSAPSDSSDSGSSWSSSSDSGSSSSGGGGGGGW